MTHSGKARRFRLLPVAATVLLGAAVFAAPAAAGDWSPNYRDYSVREETGNAATERLFRRIVLAMLAEAGRREVHRPHRRHHTDVRWTPPHRHHGKREICRTKTRVVYDDRGYRKRIVRKHCREVGPKHRRWHR